MRNHKHLLGAVALSAFALTSCGGGGGNTSPGAPAAEGAYSQEAGQYETTIRITEVSLEGFPEDMKRGIDQAKANPITQSQCMPVSISMDSMSMRNLRVTLPENMGSCNVADLSTSGGTMTGSLSCEIRNLPQGDPSAPRAINASLNFTGTYQPNTWNATMTGEATEPGNEARRGSIKVEMSSRRTGDCVQPSYSPPPSSYSPPPAYMPPPATTNTMDMPMSNSAYDK